MAESAYIAALLSGFFYLGAAISLLRLSARSGQRPERLLGLTFLLMGLSYVFYELPFALRSETLLFSFSVVGRVLYDASVLCAAVFTKQVFHRDRPWANWVLGVSCTLLVVGLLASGLYGDWEGLAPLGNPGFWLEWLGQSIPCVWVSVAALSQHANARRRVRVGLSDALVCNRFLLFGLFGVFQLCSLLLLIPMYIDYEIKGTFSTWSDQLLGAFEMLTIAAIWLAFFPPALYRRWLHGPAMAEAGGEG